MHFGGLVLGVWLAAVAVGAGTEGVEPSRRGERVAEALRARGASDDLAVAAIAALPVVELRGAVPIGIHHFKMSWWRALAVSVVGNLAPIPLILLLLNPVTRWASRSRFGERLVERLLARVRRKAADIPRYEWWGLALFVAIPLPATGAWTGAMAAALLGMPPVRSMGAIALGVLIAGAIVTALSLLGWIGAGVAAAALLAALLAGARSRSRAAARDRDGDGITSAQ
ncbi:MAG: small multi-drug export protein [Kiritimatiellae bacterium]|nr:small multi-drug export protein [Kiritimatiellia bacterium]